MNYQELYQELLQADYSTLTNLCHSDVRYNDICNSDSFWRDKIEYQQGPGDLASKPSDISWYDYYSSHYKIITLFNENNTPIGQIYTTGFTSLGELVIAAIKLYKENPDGNYYVNINIGSYIMHASDISEAWHHRLNKLGVLGYLEKDPNNKVFNPDLLDRTSVWDVLNQAKVTIFPLTLRTHSKVQHSYIKLSNGKLLGSELVNLF